MNKAKKPVTNLATKISKCYHDFLNIFSKEDLDKILPHSKYDHKIKLLNKGRDHNQAVLCGISKPQLKFVRQFLGENLKKYFIKASKDPCLLLILLAKKLESSIKFCIDYRRLSELTKKDAYLILLIAKTLMQLKSAKIFTKIDI